ncbi:MAG: dienelactone hydrolase family protein [Sphingomonas sp.]|uniref:dienelactone hydrolase family protein n=1 Tax=Sphingomonas sp. TaxID=28214 RepID=UPI00184B5EFA|nr:dienelactone hydrolase family protein [Sphingomonas sp.]MBA3667682.1 dienelactone hydrolase family protein [Sphingomonas sp.]
MIDQRTVATDFEGEALESLWLPAEGPGAAPAVLIFPTVMGVSDLEKGFGRKLNALGYGAMVADLFGKAFRGSERDVMFGELGRLKGDRAALRRRVTALLDAMLAQAEVDWSRVAAIGYCFGGLCALDLARSGADIAGVAAFHGLFDPPGLPPQPIAAKVVAFHGWDDSMVPPADVVALGKELTEAGCDWQIHAYGHVVHGFTNPGANALGIPGVHFNERAARRSWASVTAFLRECLESGENEAG